MAKSFREFRKDNFQEDEWGDDDFERRKDRKLKHRREERKKKVMQKYSAFDEKDLDD